MRNNLEGSQWSFQALRQERASSPQLEIILSVITPIPTGQRTSVLPVLLSYLRPAARLALVQAFGKEEEGGGVGEPRGEERDEAISTWQGNRTPKFGSSSAQTRGVHCWVGVFERER